MRCLAVALIAGALTLAGCSTPDAPDPRPVNGEAEQTPERDLSAHAYVCSDGRRVVAEHAGHDRLYLFFPARNFALERVPSASGTRYRNADGVEFRSQGRDARVITTDGQTLHCREDSFGSVVEDARLRGVDFLAIGNQPGWRLELGPRRTTLVTDYGERTLHFPARAIEASLAREEPVTLTLENAGVRLGIDLERRPCRDDMSGRGFPWAVTLTLDGQPLRGCGVALH